MGRTHSGGSRADLGDVFAEVFALVIHECDRRKAEAKERTQKGRFGSYKLTASENVGRDCGDTEGVHVPM
jgi:hypothetical protein